MAVAKSEAKWRRFGGWEGGGEGEGEAVLGPPSRSRKSQTSGKSNDKPIRHFNGGCSYVVTIG
jgi:hypothetical protein